MDAMVTSFSHVIYPVKSIDDTVEFYTKNLGFKLLRRYSSSLGRESAYLNLGDVLLELMQSPTAAEPAADGRLQNRIGLTVTNLDAVLAELTKRGVEIAIEPYEARTFWGRQASIKDPSGYGVSLREWQAPDHPSFDGWQPRHEGMTRTG
jgi:catechol 2,3-dioxygenase-like lactoylglutathione lyase family enzyme